MRDTFKIRSYARADNDNCSIACCNKSPKVESIVMCRRICACVILAFATVRDPLNRANCLACAACTRPLITSELSPGLADLSSLMLNAGASM